MTVDTFLRAVRKVSCQQFCRYWLDYGSCSMGDQGRGLALAILIEEPHEVESWRRAFEREVELPREMEMGRTLAGAPYLLLFWDRTEG